MNYNSAIRTANIIGCLVSSAPSLPPSLPPSLSKLTPGGQIACASPPRPRHGTCLRFYSSSRSRTKTQYPPLHTHTPTKPPTRRNRRSVRTLGPSGVPVGRCPEVSTALGTQTGKSCLQETSPLEVWRSCQSPGSRAGGRRYVRCRR